MRTVQTEGEWLEAARGRTAREVEKLVSGHKPGARPNDRPDSAVRRHVLRFDVAAETFALFREAFAKVRREAGEPLDDAAALLLKARQVLGGPKDPGRSSYPVALTLCERCGRADQLGKGEPIEVAPEIVAMCECDAQHIGRTHVSEASPSASPSPSALERAMPATPNVDHTHVGEASASASASPIPARATQTIPPATRRWVLSRDQRRCVVPGCRNAVFLDVHHLRAREEGGGHEADNLASFCGAHHRAVHLGRLVVEGRPSSGLAFRHADGSPYGAPISPAKADAAASVVRALVGLGFPGTDSRRAVDRVLRGEQGATEKQALLRNALAILTEGLGPSARPENR